MPSNQTSLLFRNDTILGVCEGVGQDFGFHPNWLRVAFALAFYFSPAAVVATYFGLGALVAASRFIYPDLVSASPITIAASEDEPLRREVRLAA